MSGDPIPRQEWKRALSVEPKVSDGAKVTGFVLVEFFDFNKVDLWSAQKTIAEKRGKSERSIRDHIAELVSAGFLTSKRGGAGQANRYEKTIPDRQKSASLDRQKSASLEKSDRQKSASLTGENLPVQTGENLPHLFIHLKEPLEEPLEGKTPPTPSAVKSKTETVDAIEADFDAWYDVYPRKVARGAAAKAYRAARKKADAPELIAGAERYASERRNEDPKYTKYPATWLNAEGWLDEAKPVHVLSPDALVRGSGGKPERWSPSQWAMQRFAASKTPERAVRAYDDSFKTIDG